MDISKFKKIEKKDLFKIEGGWSFDPKTILAITQLLATGVGLYQIYKSRQGSIALNGFGAYRWDDTPTKYDRLSEPNVATTNNKTSAGSKNSKPPFMPYDF